MKSIGLICTNWMCNMSDLSAGMFSIAAERFQHYAQISHHQVRGGAVESRLGPDGFVARVLRDLHPLSIAAAKVRRSMFS